MELEKMVPLVLYDDKCYLCTKFASAVYRLSRNKINLIGHYTETGQSIRKVLDDTALEMFWFINDDMAYGGRAALLPLVRAIISGGIKQSVQRPSIQSCDVGCKNVKAVFLRSASLLTHSKKISLK